MLKQALKTVALCLLLGIAGCKQSAGPQPATARPPLLSAEQSQEVLRILDMTDALDKMVRANNTGQPFIDLATKVEAEYLTCQAKLPEPNTAGEAFRLTIDGYSVAKTLIARKAKNSPQDPVELVANSYIRKTMLRRVLTGRATERDWRAFEAGARTGR